MSAVSQNNPYAKQIYFGVAYSAILQNKGDSDWKAHFIKCKRKTMVVVMTRKKTSWGQCIISRELSHYYPRRCLHSSCPAAHSSITFQKEAWSALPARPPPTPPPLDLQGGTQEVTFLFAVANGNSGLTDFGLLFFFLSCFQKQFLLEMFLRSSTSKPWQ